MVQRYATFLLLTLGLASPMVSHAQEHTGRLPVKPAPAHFRPVNDPSRGGGAANDECVDAIPLTVGADCVPVTGSVSDATQSFAPSECDGETAVEAMDVWYSFVATSAELIVTLEPAFDAILGVYEGSCADLGLVQCRDQAGNGMEQIFLQGLALGSTYYVRVHALEAGAPEDPSFDVCVFTPPPGYCLASAVNTGFEVIDNVAIDDVVNASTDTIGYEDFTDVVAEIAAGGSMVLIVSIGNEYTTDIVNAWADFDRNDQFDESEHVMNSQGESPHVADVPVPEGIGPGDVRLRIRLQDSDYDAVAEPCYNTFYGQVEDYTLHVTDPGGVQEHADAPWRLYPDPVNGDLVIVHRTGVVRSTVQVLDMTGRLAHQVVRTLPASTPVQIALRQELVPGSYIIRVVSGTTAHAQRFVQR